MKFIELNDLAESLAEYIEDMQLKNDTVLIENNSSNIINLKDWLLETDTKNVKIEYTTDNIKLSLS